MAFPKAKSIWVDGKFVPWDDANVHVTTHAMHYGSSVFEGMRAYKTDRGPAILGLDLHVDRLLASCKMYRLPLPFSRDEIRQACIDVVKANAHESCYIRPLAFRGAENFSLDPRRCPPHLIILTLEWGRYLGPEALEKGVDVGVSSWRRMAPDTFPALGKIGGQYINSQFVAMEATDHGYVEGIALDVNGYVSEGSGENLFVIMGGMIYTPPLSASVLKGITRTFAIQLAQDSRYVVIEQNLAREALYVADEIFFTGTAAEITPVRSVDKVKIGSGTRGPITKELQDGFFGIVEGRLPDRHNWLTFTQ
jgi:branched-chain amino acid aminotransferase